MDSEFLTDHLVHAPGLQNVHYIPNFVSEEEEQYILRQINNAPKPKWKTLPNRRLQVWGKFRDIIRHSLNSYSRLGGEITKTGKLLKQPLPPFLNKFPDIVGRIRDLGVFKESRIGEPNHVIVNEYLPGQGIMPHEDGPRYHPMVCTVSLGSHTVVNYYRYKPQEELASEQADEKQAAQGVLGSPRPIDPKPVLSVLLEPRSLVITSAELYTQYLHGISPLSEDEFVSNEDNSRGDVDKPIDEGSSLVRVANAALLSGEREREAVIKGGVLERGTRVSLTCRSVEEVLQTSKFAK